MVSHMERRFACLSTVALSVSFSRLISSKVFSPEPRPAGMLLIDVTLAVVCPRDRGRRDEDGEGGPTVSRASTNSS